MPQRQSDSNRIIIERSELKNVEQNQPNKQTKKTPLSNTIV